MSIIYQEDILENRKQIRKFINENSITKDTRLVFSKNGKYKCANCYQCPDCEDLEDDLDSFEHKQKILNNQVSHSQNSDSFTISPFDFQKNFFKENIEMGFIYFLILKNQIVYVGQSINPSKRISDHIKNPDKIFDAYYMDQYPIENMNEIEAHWIFIYAPKYNKQINNSFKNVRYITKTTPTENEYFEIRVAVLNNKLYIDLDGQSFDILPTKDK